MNRSRLLATSPPRPIVDVPRWGYERLFAALLYRFLFPLPMSQPTMDCLMHLFHFVYPCGSCICIDGVCSEGIDFHIHFVGFLFTLIPARFVLFFSIRQSDELYENKNRL